MRSAAWRNCWRCCWARSLSWRTSTDSLSRKSSTSSTLYPLSPTLNATVSMVSSADVALSVLSIQPPYRWMLDAASLLVTLNNVVDHHENNDGNENRKVDTDATNARTRQNRA